MQSSIYLAVRQSIRDDENSSETSALFISEVRSYLMNLFHQLFISIVYLSLSCCRIHMLSIYLVKGAVLLIIVVDVVFCIFTTNRELTIRNCI
ncbi:hypothetical protein ACJX0J_023110, partial [Zea mays]